MKHPLPNQWLAVILKILQRAISACILLMMVAMIAFMIREIFDLLGSFSTARDRNILHDTAFLLVIIKAYKVLQSYLLTRRVSLKYLIEIAIIAPTIEIVFAADKHSMELNLFFAAIALSNLLVYIIYYEKISFIEKDASHI